MTTVVQTNYPQPTGYPQQPPPQQIYPAAGYPQPGYPAQPATFVQVPPQQATTSSTDIGRSLRYFICISEKCQSTKIYLKY